MASHYHLRTALGQSANLGALYDARKDRFLGQSIFSEGIPGDALEITNNMSTKWEFTKNDSLEERLSKLGLSGELGVSYLTDLVSVSGSGKYLALSPTISRILQASAICTTLTKHQRLSLDSEELRGVIDADAFQSDEATHVICGVQWGARSIVTVRSKGDTTETTESVGEASPSVVALENILATFSDAHSGRPPAAAGELTDSAAAFEFNLNLDVPAGGALPTNHDEVCQYIHKLPEALKKVAAGKGKALFYELVPIQEVTKLLELEAAANTIYEPLNEESLKQVRGHFEAFEKAQQSLRDYLDKLLSHSFCVPTKHVQLAQDQIKVAEEARSALKERLSPRIQRVRGGDGSPSDIDDAISRFAESVQSPARLISITSLYSDKMSFADQAKLQGARYLPDDPEQFMPMVQDDSARAYVLHFSAAAMKSPDWQANSDKLFGLLHDLDAKGHVIIIDHDLGEQQRLVEKPYIELWEEGHVSIADFVGDAEELSDKSLLKCRNEDLIDSSLPTVALSKRMNVMLICPSKTCTSKEQVSWTCPVCKDTVYFYPKDSKLYCGCGGYKYTDAVFNCQNTTHGPEFIAAQSNSALFASLQGCKPTAQYNILILGETGVGKSTFINSFINYIMYDSLDEAMRAPDLKYAIPCSFSYEELVGREYERHTVRVGKESDVEKESKGGISATQNTVTYEFIVDGKIIRLIDTPGIGDTRGIDQDQKNVKDILETLESVDKLNTILFLMKPNSARLTATFDFCLTELLSHLHKDTNKNIVFGFTNSRSTNYMLGDTREPLEALLKKRNTNIQLGLSTLYFFDSESFRYLAAYKQLAKEMPGKDSFVASWEKSSEEARRLVERTFVLPTHEVKMTLSLNRTRAFITGMTKPMLEFSKNLQDNEKKFAAKLVEIDAFKADNTKLSQNLTITKSALEKRVLSQPRTVCGDFRCLELKDDPDDPTSGKKFTVYKTVCHDSCYVVAPQEIQGYPALAECIAFNFKGTDCTKCGHAWKLHLHISYELVSKQVQIENAAAIEKMLKNNDQKAAAELLKTTLEDEVKQLRAEDAQIKQALAKFGVYLNKSAMVAFNDTTIAYLDYMIQQAKNASAVVNQVEYEDLKKAYESQKNQIEAAIKAGGSVAPDEKEIDQIIKNLQSLPRSKNALASILPEGTVNPTEHRSVTVDLKPKRPAPRSKAGSSGGWFPSFSFGRQK
ncbi:hypothetical protein FOZG_16101 [Fusarium oxysporum Fo47]|uniref:Uncharacterized protein n=1 Tax=Fusarium oxysporum Fo47 TaxID=660027 RepID=W9JMK9_FUSOX|nr:hypothetical protein FOZG_16101 [Fusarium oxysporum Fo47]